MKKVLVNIIRLCVVIMGKLPLKFHYFIGDIISWLAKNLVRYRSDVVWINLARSFPNLHYKKIKKIYDAFYRHFGEIWAEAVWFGASSSKRITERGIVNLKNPDEINEIFLSTPSMTVLCTHCGNWELLGGILAFRNEEGKGIEATEDQVSVVYKKLNNEISDDVFKLNRTAPLHPQSRMECPVESSNILRYAVRRRNERRIYIYPTDQAPYRKAAKHPIGEFMRQQTKAMLGSVGLACKLSHSIMYMKMKRVERGKYDMTFIPICLDASTMKAEDIMRKYYDLLEEEIRETPANWLWTHKRWK